MFNRNYGSGYGHVAIVVSATINSITVIEQNWLNGAYWSPPEVATRRKHNYDFPQWFIRPYYKKTTTSSSIKARMTKPKKAKASKSKKIMLVAGHGYNDPGASGNGTNERDFIRKNITPRVKKYLESVGHTVALYGGSKQNQDMYQDTKYGVSVGNKKDYGMYWVISEGYDMIIEFHLDSDQSGKSSGGHVIISDGYPADSVDRALQDALKHTVGTIHDIDPRDDLLHCNVCKSTGMNYRLVEMGFITNKEDMNYIKNHIDLFTKRIAEAINGRQIDAKGSKPKNQKITWKWGGKFTPNSSIKIRLEPSLHGKVIDSKKWLANGDTAEFVSVTKNDGYWWIKFKHNKYSTDKYVYCAVCKITDKKERIKHEKYWGIIKWK